MTLGEHARERLQSMPFVSKATVNGIGFIIGVELESELLPGDSVVLATDVKGDPTRRAPSNVEGPMNPLANVRDLYHLGRTPEDGSLFLGSTDLATGRFYTTTRPFAARLDGTVACFLIPRKGLGGTFRAIAFRNGQGSDVAGLGAGVIAGASLGSVLLPIPIVGTFAGALVGGVLGSEVGKTVGSALLDGLSSFTESLSGTHESKDDDKDTPS